MLEPSVTLALLGSGLFFLVGLLSGIWKFAEIWQSETAQAHPYVDIAHRASLLYAFSSLVLAAFAWLSIYGQALEVWAVMLPQILFAAAIVSYLYQGAIKRTDNQLRRNPANPGAGRAQLMGFMLALIIGEVGGFVVLIAGALQNPAIGPAFAALGL
jgi:hypothetical protein